MSPTESAVAEWRGRTVVDTDGDRIGSIDEIYMDTETGRPEWLAVRTDLVGSKVSFIPVAEARDAGGCVHVPYYRQQVGDAPNAGPEEASLHRYYGLD
jgi:sporulation protein YlmC with PRC-barrel domain